MAAGLLGATRRKVEEATELFSRQMPPFLFGREALAATCNGAHQLCAPFGSVRLAMAGSGRLQSWKTCPGMQAGRLVLLGRIRLSRGAEALIG